MFKIPLIFWFEAGSFLVSLICYRKIKHTPLKWFIPFLAFIVSVELTGLYIWNVLKQYTSWLFNLSIPIEYAFYAFLLYKALSGSKIKRTALVLIFLMLLFSYGNLLFASDFTKFSVTNILVNSAVVVFLCCSYFIDLFRREEEINLFTLPMFWITTGVLFFNLGELTYNLFWDHIYRNQIPEYKKMVKTLVSSLNYVLYTFISIGLLWTKKPYHRMSARYSGES